MAGLDGGPTSRHRRQPHEHPLPGIRADHVRELSAGATRGQDAPLARAARCHRRGAPVRGARAAADLPGRVRLPGVRAHGGTARSGPVHPRGGRSERRPGLPVHRLAVQELPLRPAVHARQLRHGAAGPGRRPVGPESAGRCLQPRRGRPDRARGSAAGPVRAMGCGLRGTQPRASGARGRRRSQRHGDPFRDRSRTRPDGGREPAAAGRRGRPRGGRGRQGDGRHPAALPRALGAEQPRAGEGGPRRGPLPVGACSSRCRGIRRARARLPERRRRAAAAGRDAQHPGRDGAPGGVERHSGVVAPSLRCRLSARAGDGAVAHRAGRRLAGRRRLVDARAAALDRVAPAVVCDLAAAASGGRRRSAPAGRHARVLRLCRPHPPVARQPHPQPREAPLRRAPAHRRPRRSTPPGTRRFPGAW
ncbi:MAG: hypothetical protein JWL67_2397 [Solirubrobacterales bacterium]|nr:hypothetical protein [Solirubrobacterales bacterium]